MLHVVLLEPEIPANTGNVIRLCANTGMRLHLIHPLGFYMDDRRLRRAGLDYREYARVEEHAGYAAFCRTVQPMRIFAFSASARRIFHAVRFQPGDALLFGSESRGLPPNLLEAFDPKAVLRLPMVPGNRSLNLSNAVAVAVFEAWRQLGFAGTQELL
ncbi:tRNA (cytidine(34)-2'-O)-methyltransferase [Nitrococcus mobilis]|uniref:tRNA (cytidine(34)-2'-O)-methyltransferase n=1 Tax=Nitrococcus mobilis TaxID=35797 RepID=UPI0018DC4081|nr:tRNA (cytidine(34)-2'-O)-methyltransferase [Nitrococcus mobilis]